MHLDKINKLEKSPSDLESVPEIIAEYKRFSQEAFRYFFKESDDNGIKTENEDISYFLLNNRETAIPRIIENAQRDKEKWRDIQSVLSEEQIKHAKKEITQKLSGRNHTFKSDESTLLKLKRKGALNKPWVIADYARAAILTTENFTLTSESFLSTLFKPFLKDISTVGSSDKSYEWKMVPKKIDITFNETGYTDIQMHICPPPQYFEKFFEYYRKYFRITKEEDVYRKWFLGIQDNNKAKYTLEPIRFEIQIMPQQMLLLKTLEEPYYEIRKEIQKTLGAIGNIDDPKKAFTGQPAESIYSDIQQSNKKNWEKLLKIYFNENSNNYIGQKFKSEEYKEIFKKLREKCNKNKKSSKLGNNLLTLATMYEETIKTSQTLFRNSPTILPNIDDNKNIDELKKITKSLHAVMPPSVDITGKITNFITKDTGEGEPKTPIEQAILSANSNYSSK